MIKKFLFLLVLFVPISVFASLDRCVENGKYASQYTIDKRCYVTDAQKKEKPYNAVVALVDDIGLYCSGTIVKSDDDKYEYYLYTAKHCTVYDKSKNPIFLSEEQPKYYGAKTTFTGPVNILSIKLQSGDILKAYRVSVGDCDISMCGIKGDWAIYGVGKSDKYINSVKISDKTTEGDKVYYDARVIGYGSVKIMSDKEIEDFKQRYIKWMKDAMNLDDSDMVWGMEEGGVWIKSSGVKMFLMGLPEFYYKDLFCDENRLKVSNCKYSNKGTLRKCQVASGDSGGGIFDYNGNIMAIGTSGYSLIGGPYHLRADEGENLLGTQ